MESHFVKTGEVAELAKKEYLVKIIAIARINTTFHSLYTITSKKWQAAIGNKDFIIDEPLQPRLSPGYLREQISKVFTDKGIRVNMG